MKFRSQSKTFFLSKTFLFFKVKLFVSPSISCSLVGTSSLRYMSPIASSELQTASNNSWYAKILIIKKKCTLNRFISKFFCLYQIITKHKICQSWNSIEKFYSSIQLKCFSQKIVIQLKKKFESGKNFSLLTCRSPGLGLCLHVFRDLRLPDLLSVWPLEVQRLLLRNKQKYSFKSI